MASRPRTPPRTSGQPFLQLQRILDKQQARPLRQSPSPALSTTPSRSQLILHQRRVEERGATAKRMFPEKLGGTRTWNELIEKTSTEETLARRVHVSPARAFQADSKRVMIPEKNQEVSPRGRQRQPASPRARPDPHLLSGRSVSALDKRVANKAQWKVGLINQYENSQEQWAPHTGAVVDKLKEEVGYNPQRDFVASASPVSTGMKKKLDQMHRQGTVTRENMRTNPVTGTGERQEAARVSRRKIGMVAGGTGTAMASTLGYSSSKSPVRTNPPSGKKQVPQATRESPIPRDSGLATPPRSRHRQAYAQAQGLNTGVRKSTVVMGGGRQ